MRTKKPSETKAGPAGKDPNKIEEARKALKPVDIALVREEITQLVANQAFGMILSTIEEVHEGHHATMKFLFEIAGIYPVPEKGEDAEDHGLAKTLLDRLGIQVESIPETDYERLPAAAMGAGPHAVK